MLQCRGRQARAAGRHCHRRRRRWRRRRRLCSSCHGVGDGNVPPSPPAPKRLPPQSGGRQPSRRRTVGYCVRGWPFQPVCPSLLRAVAPSWAGSRALAAAREYPKRAVTQAHPPGLGPAGGPLRCSGPLHMGGSSALPAERAPPV
jgi:hypothetical protein